MPVYCKGCGIRVDKVDRDENGQPICPNPKCKVAMAGNGTFEKPET
jgi:hypothetical protein